MADSLSWMIFFIWCSMGIHGSAPFCGSIFVLSLQLIPRDGTASLKKSEKYFTLSNRFRLKMQKKCQLKKAST
jgi:hypothetical protein